MKFSEMPKTHLHLHLEGAVRPATACEFYNRRPWTSEKIDAEEFRARLQMADMENDFSAFLSKFSLMFSRDTTADDLIRVTEETVKDQSEDSVRYLELRFCPDSFEQKTGITPKESLSAVLEGIRFVSGKNGNCRCGLIVIIDQRLGPEKAEDLFAVVDRTEELCSGVCAFDIASDPKTIPLEAYGSVCRRIRRAGYGLTVHAGELMGPDTVRTAVEVLGAERIGHGIKAASDKDVMRLLAERNIPLEVCLMSNFYTGAVRGLAEHPLKRLMDAGVPVTLNTDDPMIFGKKLSEEYALAEMLWRLSEDDFKKFSRVGIACAFTDSETKKSLENEFDRIWMHTRE